MRYGTQQDQVDKPYHGDFDGDGKADFRVQRRNDPSSAGTTPAIFYTLRANGQVSYDYFGLNYDRVLPGYYDGDGKDDVAMFTPTSTGERVFAYRPSIAPSESLRSYGFGAAGDLPAAGYNNR